MNRLFRAFMCVLAMISLSACATNFSAPKTPAEGENVGIVSAMQPQAMVDLLAGYIPEGREFASLESVQNFNDDVLYLVTKKSENPRSIKVVTPPNSISKKIGDKPALVYWAEVARSANVDLLIVPQILNWHELDGSSVGAVSPASVFIQYYLIDAKSGNMLARSVFKEQQQSLSGNLLNASTFFKRGGKWLTARELANEGTTKMIREFGL